MNRRGFSPIIVLGIVAIILIVGAIGYFTWLKSTGPQVKISQNFPLSKASSSPAIAASSPTEISINDAPNGFQYSGQLQYQTYTYAITYVSSSCVAVGCDAILLQTNNATKQQTVLIPSFWRAVPALREVPYAQIDLLYGQGSSITIHIYSNYEFGSYISFFEFNTETRQLQKLTYGGAPNCGEMSTDFHYFAADTKNSSTEEIEIFSLRDNADVYSKVLSSPQTLWDGSNGPGGGGGSTCDNLGWAATDTMSYTIYDSSKVKSDGTFSAVKTVTQSFPNWN